MGVMRRFPTRHNSGTELHNYIFLKDWKAATIHLLQCKQKDAKQGLDLTFENGDGVSTTRALPLHLAVMNQAPLDFITILVATYPKALRRLDTNFSRCPLHYACWRTPCPKLTAFLLMQQPDAASLVDVFGRVPLHYAAYSGARQCVVEYLLKANPNGATQADYMKWLPLHVAVRYNCAPGVVDCLIRHHPDGLTSQTRKGSMTPIDIAGRFDVTLNLNVKEDTADMLWGAEKQRDVHGHGHGHRRLSYSEQYDDRPPKLRFC
jgi:ankyrin repeat protein